MKQLDKRQIVGWIAVSISTAITCIWAFWGIIENFHEGWYSASLLSNVGLMFVQYLSPMLIFMGVTLISIYWPRLGGSLHAVLALLAIWFFQAFSNAATFLIILPLVGLGALYWFGRSQPRKLAVSLAVALPFLTLIISGIQPVIRVSQRIDDGFLQARMVHGNGVNLVWAPDGPGWPRAGADWYDAQQVCQHLSKDGLTLASIPQNIWRLPTVDEAVRSMARHGQNSAGVWDAEIAEADYNSIPDKESPLWNIHSQVIYWWTATEVDEDHAYIIVYDGKVWPRAKHFSPAYLGFRCVSDPALTTQPTATDIGTQEPATTGLSSTDEDTALPEDEDYWPTEAWRVAAPDEQGMDAALLGQMLEAIDEQNLNINSLVVVHNGYIVFEKYYPPYKQDTLNEIYSVTKSVVSALIGIAIQEGHINSVDDLVLDFFPERTFENENDLKQSITLEHLLTMSSGLEWDFDEMVASRDWVQYVLDKPMYIKPGTAFHYNSGNAHVLSAIIQETSGLNTQDFAQQHLFDFLGISEIKWQRDIDGISIGGWGLKMTPRDMAKLGYLYLNQGRWDGRQIIPTEWITASIKRYVQVPEPLEPWDLYMGYLWWLHEDGLYAAHGMKGKFIYVIPESDLVVVITANISDDKFAQPQLLIRDYIIPAVIEATH